MRRSIWVVVAALALLAAAACDSGDYSPEDVGAKARASLAGPDGQAMGEVTLTQTRTGVLIAADVTGLTPGAHGFHVHGVGACSPDFKAAGSHFAPGGEPHGFLNPDGPHAGDLPNIHAGDDGNARAEFFTDAVTLDDGADHSLFDDDGSAFIVHAGPDDYRDVASAGARVACGVIERS